MSDKGEINTEGTTPEEIYKYRFEHSEDRKTHPINDWDYYYIKKYESDMKWYKKYIIRTIIIIIIIIVLIILILSGFIKSVVVIGSICGGISLLCLSYFYNEYRNSKKNRDESIQDAKVKIENEIQKEIEEEEKINNIIKQNNDALKKFNDQNAIKIIEETPKINEDINNIANNRSMNNTEKIDALYGIYLSKIDNNIYYLDYYNEFIKNNINFDQKIKDEVRNKISQQINNKLH